MKKYLKLLIISLLVTISSPAFAEKMWQPSTRSYKSVSISPDYQKKKLVFLKPLWTAKVVSNEYQLPMTLTDGKTVWIGTPEGAKAINLKIGKQLWLAQVKDIQTIAGYKDKIFIADKKGILNAFDKATGKPKWVQKLALGSSILRVNVIQENLYLRWSNGFAKLDPNTGEILWEISKPSSVYADEPMLFDDVLLQNYTESGAITVTVLYAFDNKTGKKLWSNSVDGGPLLRKENTLYLASTWIDLDRLEIATITAVDLHTGKGQQTIKYPKAFFKAQTGSFSMLQKVMVSDGYLYLDVYGDIKKFYLGVDPNKFYANQKGVFSSVKERWLAGPINDIIIFDKNGNLNGTGNDADIYYEGVNNPVSSFEVFNRAIIVGQTDGRLLGCDFLTGKNLFASQTDARTYQVIKVIGNYLLVQGDGKLYVYAAPKLNALSKEVTKPHYTKTEIKDYKISANNKIISLKANVIMLSGNKMLPLLEFINALNGQVSEDKNSGLITLKIMDKVLTLKPGDYYGRLNGQIVGINPAPQLINGIVYIPEKFMDIMLDGKLKFDQKKKTYEIKLK